MVLEFQFNDRGDKTLIRVVPHSVHIGFERITTKGDITEYSTHTMNDQLFLNWMSRMMGLGVWAMNQPRIITQIPDWMRVQLNL